MEGGKIDKYTRVIEVLKQNGPGLTAADIMRKLELKGYKVAKSSLQRWLRESSFALFCEKQGYELHVLEKEKAHQQRLKYSLIRKDAVKIQPVHYEKFHRAMHVLRNMLPSPTLGYLAKPYLETMRQYESRLAPQGDNTAKSFQKIDTSAHLNMFYASNWGECLYQKKELENIENFLWAFENKRYVTLEVLSHNSSEHASMPAKVLGIPLRIYYHRGTFYFMLKVDQINRPVLYEVESVNKVDGDNDNFNSDEECWTDEQVAELFQQRFGVTAPEADDAPVETIRLMWGKLPKKKFFVEWRHWHTTQRFDRNEEGRLVMEFEAQINRELVGWIMMWLDHIEVLAPESLRKRVHEKALAIANIYEGGKVKDGNHPGDF